MRRALLCVKVQETVIAIGETIFQTEKGIHSEGKDAARLSTVTERKVQALTGKEEIRLTDDKTDIRAGKTGTPTEVAGSPTGETDALTKKRVISTGEILVQGAETNVRIMTFGIGNRDAAETIVNASRTIRKDVERSWQTKTGLFV